LAFEYALENAGSIDPEKVRDALAKLDVTTFYGLLKFDSRGLNVYKPMVTNQIQNGKLVTVWPAGWRPRSRSIPRRRGRSATRA
jgi:branched-chain amino acid transport system substrate-binding protein